MKDHFFVSHSHNFVLVTDCLYEVLDQSLFLLARILDIPGSGSFTEIFHQTSLEVEPEKARHIEGDSGAEKVERYPLESHFNINVMRANCQAMTLMKAVNTS